MNIGHFSDIHGNISIIEKFRAENDLPDFWISTGDFFPNLTYGIKEEEVTFQPAWFEREAKRIINLLGGRPIICVDGNHDFVSFGDSLRAHNYPAIDVYDGVEFLGLKFAGFREIPYIYGRWVGESSDDLLRHRVDQTMAHNPDIILTHAAPAGILDYGNYKDHYGIVSFYNALFYREHKVRACFFGHVHEPGGKRMNESGIEFVNSARCAKMISLD